MQVNVTQVLTHELQKTPQIIRTSACYYNMKYKCVMEYPDMAGSFALLIGNIRPHSWEVYTSTTWHPCSKALPYCYCFIY